MDCPDNGRSLRQETGYFTWDILDNLVCIDEVCADIFEFSPAAGASGLPIEAFLNKIHPPERERIAKAIHDNLVDGGMYDEEYPLALSSGNRRWVRVVGRMLLDDDGLTFRGMGTMVDVTFERLLGVGNAEKATRQ